MEINILKNVPLEERRGAYLQRFIELEHASYPPSEAASIKSLELRVTQCADWFVYMTPKQESNDPKAIVGFACGTLGSSSAIVSEEVMTTHQPKGNRFHLHSVVVQESLRGQGLALRLVQAVVEAVKATERIEAISLITKAKGIALYNRAGFSFKGDSPLRYGSERWYAMDMQLKSNKVVCVDAFAHSVFGGNSAAVVLLPDKKFEKIGSQESSTKKLKADVEPGTDNTYLGLLAREFNVAETAFVQFDNLAGTGFGSTLDPLARIIAMANSRRLTEFNFNETLATIKKHFQFRQDVKFRVGDVKSEKGQNLGSLCVMAFAQACGLDRVATARMWCEHHTNVLEHPNETSHPNIRAFLLGGEVVFSTADDEKNVLVTPIESFDLLGLATICTSPTMKVLRTQALQLIDTNVQFLSDMSAEKKFELFKSWFIVDDHDDVATEKLTLVKSVSQDMLAILIRSNVVNVPQRVVSESLGSTSPAEFCERYELDDQAVERLGLVSKTSKTGLLVDASLRWFTPAQVEVDLCGHATLAAAQAIFFEFGPIANRSKFSEIRFRTRSGVLLARKMSDSSIELEFPGHDVKVAANHEKLRAQISQCFPLLSPSDAEFIGETTTNDHIVVVNHTALHNKLGKIDLAAISAIFQKRGVCITCAEPAGGEVQFSSRFFAPRVGINEDPATGSAHCFLAPFWLNKLKMTKTNVIVGQQLSERYGRIECELADSRVLLRGKARVSWRGECMLL